MTLSSSTLPPLSGWVDLIRRPQAFSDSQALLLCQEADDRWVAWIPDYGEIILYRYEFYLPCERN